MSKEQISIRLAPETLKKVDEIAVSETRTRNNVIEVLIVEAITIRERSKKSPQPDP